MVRVILDFGFQISDFGLWKIYHSGGGISVSPKIPDKNLKSEI
jgi:hypothetical protein